MSNELYHHGILGQKWGVRRFQNPDGTLTAKGRARQKSNDRKEYEEISKKSAKEMSNAELRKANDRLNLENNYSNLSKQNIEAGKAFAKAVLTAATVSVASTVVANGLEYAIRTGMAKTGAKAAADVLLRKRK